MRTDMNPLLPDVCGCERPLVDDDRCLCCGRTFVPGVAEETFSPAQQVVIICIKAWAGSHGRPPTTNDWAHRADGHPSFNQVIRLFGSWNAGIRAAGLSVNRATGKGLAA